MQYTMLGRTELNVSQVCFGTWAFGGDWGAVDVAENRAAIRRALELGINFFDTAQGYGWGASERMLAEALSSEIQGDRHGVVLATKGGVRREGDRTCATAVRLRYGRAWRRAYVIWAPTTSTSTRSTGPTPTRR